MSLRVRALESRKTDESVLQGVSTRNVGAITEELSGESFSKSTVSQLASELDVRMKAWNERSLSAKSYPFLVIDALVIKVQSDGAVRSQSTLMATGIGEDSYREILGLRFRPKSSVSNRAAL